MNIKDKILSLKNYNYADLKKIEATPLQSFKFCPSCGTSSLTLKSEKSVYCNNCNYLLYTNPAAAVCAVIISDNKILFTVRNREPKKNMLDLPGGFIDLNETAETAVFREIKEELNLNIVSMTYIISIPNVYEYKMITYNTLDMFFLCEVSTFENISFDDEISDFKLLSIEELDIEKDIGLDSIKSFFKILKGN